MKYLLIAEKPSAMKAIKAVYDKHQSEINQKVGFIEFTNLVGHVCRLRQPKEYEEWDQKWEDISLPMIPKTFLIDKSTSDVAVQKIIDIKKKLKDDHIDGIIVATDSDVEGNGIYYLLANYLEITNMPTLRYYEEDQTEAKILKSLLNLTDFYKNPRDTRMTDSYIFRSRWDWLTGMNFTTGITVKSGIFAKVGPVKTPTLKMVYDNCEAIDNFKSKTDYELVANYKEGFSGILQGDEQSKRFETKEAAENFAKSLSKKAIIEKLERKDVKTAAPQLYKLTDIQGDAGKALGFSPDKTLMIVQSLYEKKIVSYPRTDGRYISTEKAKEFPRLLKAVACFNELKPYVDNVSKDTIEAVKKNNKIVNDDEVARSSHDALLPTGELFNPDELSDEEKSVCKLIFIRMLALFLPPLLEKKTTILANCDDELFKTVGKKTLDAGYTVLYNKKSKNVEFPDLKVGDTLNIDTFEANEKTTTPPKRFTQSSLVVAMENIDKYMDSKELKKVMKEARGIGTPATRAAIITDLLKTGYMVEKGKGKSAGLYMTDTGKAYIKLLSPFEIVKPDFRAHWEQRMSLIRQGEESFNDVYKEAIEYLKEAVKSIESAPIERIKKSSNKKTEITCPKCGKKIIEKNASYSCESNKWKKVGTKWKMIEGCGFSLQKEIAGAKIDEKQLSLICDGKASDLLNFKSKKGPFKARLYLDKDELKFKMD